MTSPLPASQMVDNYWRQRYMGRQGHFRQLTPKQRRRVQKKRNKELGGGK